MENLNSKGLWKGACNRTACQKPGALYFNSSTRKYYCFDCATLINNDNPQLNGEDLCQRDEAGLHKTDVY